MSDPNRKIFSAHPHIEYGDFKVRDFTRHARILVEIRENDRYTADYYIRDNETPTSLAQDFYGNPNLFWILLNLNDMIDPWKDWPMKYWELVQYTKGKYRVEDEGETMFWGIDGLWFRDYEITEALLKYEWAESREHFKSKADKMSYFDYENFRNDEKRLIRIVRPEQIDDVVMQYRKEINQ